MEKHRELSVASVPENKYEDSSKRRKLDEESSYEEVVSGPQDYSHFSIFGQDNFKKQKNLALVGPTSNFHSRLMHVLHPSLKYSPALDKHFMRVIQKIENSGEEKMLDEHNSTQYKDLLIG